MRCRGRERIGGVDHGTSQPTQRERAPPPAAACTRARRIRHMRDLRATSRQNTAHTTPAKRRGRRDHPRVTRRRPIGMGQRAPDTPTLQPAQKQPQRRLRASAAHTNTTTKSDKPATEHKHMVNTNNHSQPYTPHGEAPGRPRRGDLGQSADILTEIR